MKLIVKVKLITNKEQHQSLLKTMDMFNTACNYISKKAFKENRFGQVSLHHICYRDVRNKFNLSSQFTVRAIGKVSESYKINKKSLHKFKKYSAIVYDDRLLSFRNLDIASILTVNGRTKIPIIFGEYANLRNRRIRRQADLTFENNKFFLNLVIEIPDGVEIKPTGYLGVDKGITNIATTSDGKQFSGKHLDNLREKLTTIKSKLQKKGTKSAKRHLKKISRRENRFRKNINHFISKYLVSVAQGTQRGIALENLKGIRLSTTVRKKQRFRFGSWSFYQLDTFIKYKAKIAGIPIKMINPKNTSRTCSKCDYISKSNRKSQSKFSCQSCDFSLNADINAAINIAKKAAVDLPIAVRTISNPIGTASY